MPRLGSIISGIPGHYIEDVKISNVQVLHQGGGTKEDAAYQPPEYEDMYPNRPCSSWRRGQAATGGGRTVSLFPKGRGGEALEETRRPASLPVGSYAMTKATKPAEAERRRPG